MGSIRLSPKHGLNPSMAMCFYCGKEKNEIALLGRIKGKEDKEAPRKIIFDKEPCDECQEGMKQGITVFEANSPKYLEPNEDPRTGRMVVIKEEAVINMLEENKDMLESVLKLRVFYMTPEDFDAMFSEALKSEGS